MTPSESAALEALVDGAIARVASFPVDEVLRHAREAKTLLYGPEAQTSAEHRRPFKDVYTSTVALQRDLDARAPAIKGGVVALLGALDPDAAAVFIASVLPYKLEAFAFGTWQADLWYALWLVLPDVASRIPLAMLAELAMQRRIPDSYQRDEMWGAIPLAELERAMKKERTLDLDVDDLFAQHAALRDGATVLGLLEKSIDGLMPGLRNALVIRLGELDYKAAIPHLRTLLENKGTRGLANAASATLRRLGDSYARDHLIASLPTLLDDRQRGGADLGNALRAAIELDPARSSETLATYFAAAALATAPGQRRAERILGQRASVGGAIDFDSDARWPAIAAGLLAGPLFEAARAFLATFDGKSVKAALQAAKYVAPAAAAPRTHPVPKHPRWLARYESGEHETVWAEIVALEDSAQDPAIVEEATAVARAMMARVRTNLEAIVAQLKKRKYVFAAKTAKKVLAAPDAKAATEMAAIEKITGAKLPLAVRAFWEVVGSVDLTERDAASESVEGLGECDPLMIEPPKLSLALLKDRVADEKRFPVELRRVLSEIWIGLDPTNKFDRDDANNDPYTLEIVGTRADALLRQGDRVMPFVAYLRAVITKGGFYGEPPDDERKETADAALAAMRQGRIAF